MNKKITTFLVSVGLISLLLSSVVTSRRTFYQFVMGTPEEVEASAGQTVTVPGTILNEGMFFLHNFDITLEGLPEDFEYEVNPAHWQDVRILREWNPDDGSYRVPEEFEITITVPSSAADGLHVVTVTGQEHHSFREVTNSTFFVLHVGEGAGPSEPTGEGLDVSDILVPETITSGEEFTLTFRLDNGFDEDMSASVSIVAPDDWEIEKETLLMRVGAGSSEIGTFTITPTDSEGRVSLLVEYPFNQTIVSTTKEGPYLRPVSTTEPTTTTVPDGEEKPFFVDLYDRMKAGVKEVLGDFARPLIIGIIVVLAVIVIWLVVDIVGYYRGKDTKAEEIKKGSGKASVSSQETVPVQSAAPVQTTVPVQTQDSPESLTDMGIDTL